MNVQCVLLLMLLSGSILAKTVKKSSKKAVELNTNDISEDQPSSRPGKNRNFPRSSTVSLSTSVSDYDFLTSEETTEQYKTNVENTEEVASRSGDTVTSETDTDFRASPQKQQTQTSQTFTSDPNVGTVTSENTQTTEEITSTSGDTVTSETDTDFPTSPQEQQTQTSETFTTDPKVDTVTSENTEDGSFFVTEFTTSTSSDPPVSTEVTTTSTTTRIPCPENLTVRNLKPTPSSFSVILQWDPPENTDCVEKYKVHLERDYELPPTQTEFNIADLVACKKYSATVTVISESTDGPEVVINFTTTTPNPFSYGVGKISFNETENLSVTWDPVPDSVVRCVTSYKVTWTDTGGTITGNKSVDATETSTELKKIGCVEYQIDIQPKTGENLYGNNVNASYKVAKLPTNPPSITEGPTPNKTYVTLTWKTDTNEENKCKLEEIVADCTPSGGKTLKINGGIADFTFPMTISNLSAFTEYSCSGYVVNEGGMSESYNFTFKTLEDVPTVPRDLRVENVEFDRFTVKWTEPEDVPGILDKYILVIINEGPDFAASEDCAENKSTAKIIPPNQLEYTFTEAVPFHKYIVKVGGVDGAGRGPNANTTLTTKAAAPNKVKNIDVSYHYAETGNYSAFANVTYESSCTNGPLSYYQIHYKGVREGFADDENTFKNDVKLWAKFSLKPERKYTIDITTVIEGGFSSTQSYSTSNTTKSGVPSLSGEGLPAPKSNETNRAFFTLSKNAVDNSAGTVLYYALTLLPMGTVLTSNYGFWNGTNWPKLFNETGSQLTDDFWNPFQNGKNDTVFVITSLEEDTEYVLVVRALTADAYNSWSITFRTAVEQVNLGLILGLTFGLLALAAILCYYVFIWRKKRKGYGDGQEKSPSECSPGPISCKKFADYYATIVENNNIIKNQYATIGDISKELGLSTSYALLPENKRKNRYTNILPYDDNRVKLQIDEDDEIGSDYINASYIKGYSNRVEYIATQGPLELTSKDFWKMIFQENVTIIVMVSQFIEQSKEKCFQYFPNNHEKMSFGEAMEIRCSTELHFGTYCVRTLQIRKDAEQRNVYHMQFLEWPDFGVPQGTDNMLEFCHQVREKVVAEGGLIAVHCSAGVGRTGTLIALDILLQTIDNHRDINIYKTVLDLRKQRINMVQTEKQYMFIHTCIKEYLEMSTVQSKEQVQDRVYENMDVLRSSMKKNLLETEVESAL